jgi:DNA-binding HxlR family transcriptional regulator
MSRTELTPAEILKEHVTLEVESIDRMYLNLYVPGLQVDGYAAAFFLKHRGETQYLGQQMSRMTQGFREEIDRFADCEDIPVVHFENKQRKDDEFLRRLKSFRQDEGVVFIGVAQEKAHVMRVGKREKQGGGKTYAWISKSTAMVNHVYFYAVDADFGPFFIKFCTYFPYPAKLCINGHEYAKRQLTRRGIGFTALDNGFLTCEDPAKLQKVCDGLSAEKIERLARKWLRRLPHPFEPRDRRAGYRYELSMIQTEFSLTQVLDRPVHGRLFFEQVIRENLDIGRPDQVSLIFQRSIRRNSNASFRTRVITEGVIPSLHVYYKSVHLKQYFKEGRALRTETTINNNTDVGIRKKLPNLSALRPIGFSANRRLLDVQRATHDCMIGQTNVEQFTRPAEVNGQRVPAFRFDDPRVQALFSVLVLFCLQPEGFRSSQIRAHLAPLLGLDPVQLTQGQISYHLRRLRLRGLIERIPKSHRYRVTATGLRIAMIYSRTYARVLRPALSLALDQTPRTPAQRAFHQAFSQVDMLIDQAQLAAA